MKGENDKITIDIFSDIHFNGFQHVNQMLFNEIQHSHKYQVRFFQRFYMHGLSFNRIRNLLRGLLNQILIKKNQVPDKHIQIPDVYTIYSFPPSQLSFLNWINSSLVRYQIGRLSDVAIIFVPSPGLQFLFNSYQSLVYYCVHDSIAQNYHQSILDYEKRLVTLSRYVLCDNEQVLTRLANGSVYQNISKKSNKKTKFYYIPAPVPNEFYEQNMTEASEYDFIYFGSLHKDIDTHIFKRIYSAGYSILCITEKNEFYNLIENFVTWNPITSSLKELNSYIAKGKYILLPYQNTKFMHTVTPAKINQCLVTGKKVFCTNKLLSDKYNLIYFDDCKSISEIIDTAQSVTTNELTHLNIKNIAIEIMRLLEDNKGNNS